jgi:hypothetical protein
MPAFTKRRGKSPKCKRLQPIFGLLPPHYGKLLAFTGKT